MLSGTYAGATPYMLECIASMEVEILGEAAFE